jgi:polysaccharide deacetylase 2 family uncharacterized protein YibQ
VRTVFSLVVIVFSLAAIAGGVFAKMPIRIPLAPSHVNAPPSGSPRADERAADEFAGDPAVIGDDASSAQHDARVALVLVHCGHSLALESPFVLLDVPMTLVVDAGGPVAHEVADLATQAGDDVYLQMSAGDMRRMARLHTEFPNAEGVAARLADGASPASWIRAAKSENLAFFDEYSRDRGIAQAFDAAGVRYAGRTITIDDHAQVSYVAYMFAQAVRLGRSQTAVTLARPVPATLHALEHALASGSPRADFVHLP